MEIKVVGFSIAKEDIEAVVAALNKASGQDLPDIQGALKPFGWHVRVDGNGVATKLQCLKFDDKLTKDMTQILAPFVSPSAQILIEEEGQDTLALKFEEKKGGSGGTKARCPDVKGDKPTKKTVKKTAKKDEETPTPEPQETTEDKEDGE